MNVIEKPIVEEINSSYRNYALYTLYNRAIPSAVDGLKPVQRKILYGMLQMPNCRKQEKKIADIGSISIYNYHHGEASAQAAATLMGATWCNNAPLFTGHGNFGSRLIQEAASARYIFATLSPNYDKFFKDEEVAPKNFDEESPEPAHYLPLIPWVLVNGISGIAVGFATNILPRSPDDLKKQVKLVLQGKKAKNVLPSYPDFRGVVEELDPGTYRTLGIITTDKSGFTIDELPIGYDREKYITFLNDLLDSNQIRDYEDMCSEHGFKFQVKVNRAQKEHIVSKDPMKFFKLIKQETENLTTIGHDGNLKIFGSSAELIEYFVEYRLTKVAEKIQLDIDNTNLDLEKQKAKLKFVQMVLAGKIDMKKLSKQELLDAIAEHISKQDFARGFINIPLWQLTVDMVDELKQLIQKLESDLQNLKSETPTSRYLEMIG